MIQLQVLNYILSSKSSYIISSNNLNDSYFSEYRGEFKFIQNHLEQYNVVPDVETFLKSFPNFELFTVNEPEKYLVDELFNDYKKRTLAASFTKIKDLVLANKMDDALKVYRDGLDNLSTGVSVSCVDILHDTSRYEDFLERTQNYAQFYVTTGFKELDAALGGIDRREELGVVMARTNKGKSWILLKMAAACAVQGLTVGIYSGEMSVVKVASRVDTYLSHISNGAIIHGNESIQNTYKKYLDELPTKYSGKLLVTTPDLIGGPAGVNSLRAFIEKNNLDILFVDQISLLEDDRRARDKVEKVANISKDLKNLQVLKQIPIIFVSQQNRTKNDDKEDDESLDTTQVALCDRIAQDATFLLGITRDKKDDSIMTIHIVKARDSAVGKRIHYVVDFDKGLFEYIPDEKDAVNGNGCATPKPTPTPTPARRIEQEEEDESIFNEDTGEVFK